MYRMNHYRETDPQRLFRFMQTYAFVQLTGVSGEGRAIATQVPVLVEGDTDKCIIHGHIMRKTDHHLAFEQNPQALMLFTGPHCYVSSSWYTDPQQASTWNYMTVQASGTLEWLSTGELRQLLENLTNRFETDPDSPARYEQIPTAYIERLLPAIIGFKMEVQSLDSVFKLSQNRDHASYQRIIRQLEAQGGEEALIARAMREREEELF